MDGKYKGMTRNVTKNEKLTELDKAILLTIYTRGGKSRRAHFPVEFICRGFPSHLHGKIKNRVETLWNELRIVRKRMGSGRRIRKRAGKKASLVLLFPVVSINFFNL